MLHGLKMGGFAKVVLILVLVIGFSTASATDYRASEVNDVSVAIPALYTGCPIWIPWLC